MESRTSAVMSREKNIKPSAIRTASRLSVAVLLLTALVAVSCIGRKVYDHYEELPIAGWEKNDTITFFVPSVDRSGLYSLDLGLRTTSQYPFMSLTLVIERFVIPLDTTTVKPLFPIPLRPSVSTLSCRLRDSRGHAKGQGINYYQYDFHVADISLNAGDSLRVNIRHDMKREILPGISDLGIRLHRN